MASKVYFSRTITPEKVLELYQLLGKELPGRVAVKVHSGETGNQNFLRPAFWRPVIRQVQGTVVECNTAYEGTRNTTEKHWKTMKHHGWSDGFTVDILDGEGPDLELPIPNGKQIQKNFVGRNLTAYDSMLVLSHFKGHPQAAVYRRGFLLRQGLYPRSRRAGEDLVGRSRLLPALHGRCCRLRGGLLPRRSRLYQRNGQYVRGLRLLRGGGGSLHEGYRYSGFSGSRGH